MSFERPVYRYVQSSSGLGPKFNQREGCQSLISRKYFTMKFDLVKVALAIIIREDEKTRNR